MTNPLDQKINDTSEALQFLHQTVNVAGLNLNPELGFLKADNTSAFQRITDEHAQYAQMRLVECTELLSAENVDIWEVSMMLSIHDTLTEFVRAHIEAGRTSKVFNEEYLANLDAYLEGEGLAVRQHDLENETDAHKEMRRAEFVMHKIHELQSLNPALDLHAQESNGYMAMVFCADLFPPGWAKILDNYMATMQAEATGTFSCDASDIAEVAKDKLDNALIDMGDYDDDPTEGLYE